MSEAQLPEKVEVIKPDAIIAVEISTGFYQRIQNIVAFILEGKTRDELLVAHKQIETSAVEQGSWVEQYETLLILCKEFELQAREKNMVESILVSELENAG